MTEMEQRVMCGRFNNIIKVSLSVIHTVQLTSHEEFYSGEGFAFKRQGMLPSVIMGNVMQVF